MTAEAFCDCRTSGAETSRNQASGPSQVSAHTLLPHPLPPGLQHLVLAYGGRQKGHLVLGLTFMKDPKSRL